jgi:hypothetical protein
MGWLNNTSKFLHGVGEKVKNVGQVVGTLKGIYDVGKNDLRSSQNDRTNSRSGNLKALIFL